MEIQRSVTLILLQDSDLAATLAALRTAQQFASPVCYLGAAPLRAIPHQRTCYRQVVRRRKLSAKEDTPTSGRPMTPSQWILSHCPHVNGSPTLATPVVSNEPGGVQATQAPLTGSLSRLRARGSPDGSTQVNCLPKASSGKRSAIRLTHSDQNGMWVAEQKTWLSSDGTHSHRSIGRTHPGRISTLGTTLSPMSSRSG
jgi:hypothetical protein